METILLAAAPFGISPRFQMLIQSLDSPPISRFDPDRDAHVSATEYFLSVRLITHSTNPVL